MYNVYRKCVVIGLLVSLMYMDHSSTLINGLLVTAIALVSISAESQAESISLLTFALVLVLIFELYRRWFDRHKAGRRKMHLVNVSR